MSIYYLLHGFHPTHLSPPPKGMVIVSFSVINVGKAPSEAIKPGILLEAYYPNPPSGPDTVVFNRLFLLPSLAAGREHYFNIPFDGADLLRRKAKMIRVEVDPKNLITESNELNNTATIGL